MVKAAKIREKITSGEEAAFEDVVHKTRGCVIPNTWKENVVNFWESMQTFL